MPTILIAAALAAPLMLKDIDARRSDGELRVRVTASGPLAGGRAELKPGKLVVVLPGVTQEKFRQTFHHHHRYIVSQRVWGGGLKIEVPIGSTVTCGDSLELLPRPDGTLVRADCGKGEADEEDAAEPAEASAKQQPSKVEAQPAPVRSESAKVEAQTAEVRSQSGKVEAQTAEVRSQSGKVEAQTAEVRSQSGKVGSQNDLGELQNKTEVFTKSPRATTAAPAAAQGGPLSLWMPVAALLVLAGAAFFFGKRRASTPRHLQILETQSLGPKRSLVLARVGGETLLLSASEAGITLIAQLPKGDAPIAIAADKPAAPTFTEELKKQVATFLPRKKEPHKAAFEELFVEAAEDQELRHKLAAGLSGQVQ